MNIILVHKHYKSWQCDVDMHRPLPKKYRKKSRYAQKSSKFRCCKTTKFVKCGIILFTTATVLAYFNLYTYKTLAIIYGGKESDYPAREDRERESLLRAGLVNNNIKSEGSSFKSGQKHFNTACNQQVFTSPDESSEEIPVVIFVGRKQIYRFLYRVLDSVKAAHFYGKNDRNYRQKRLCFLLVDDDRGRDMNIVLSRKAKRSFSKLCRKIVMLRSHGIQSKLYTASHVKILPNDAAAKAKHLKQ